MIEKDLIKLGVVSKDTMGEEDETCENVNLLVGTGSIVAIPEQCFQG